MSNRSRVVLVIRERSRFSVMSRNAFGKTAGGWADELFARGSGNQRCQAMLEKHSLPTDTLNERPILLDVHEGFWFMKQQILLRIFVLDLRDGSHKVHLTEGGALQPLNGAYPHAAKIREEIERQVVAQAAE